MWVSVALAAACCLALLDAAPAPQLPVEPLPQHAKQASGSLDTRICRLSVGQPYTLQQKHHHRKQQTPATAQGSPAALRAEPPAAARGAEAPVTESVGARIIRVPKRRTATGCRYYQRTDVLGQCRTRW